MSKLLTHPDDPEKVGREFTFRNHDWQKDILNGITHERVIHKHQSVGLSEVYIQEALLPTLLGADVE